MSDDAYRQRHDLLRAVLLVHLLALVGYAGVRGLWHVFLELAALGALLLLASSGLSVRMRASAVALGLYGCSAVTVHLSGGQTEAHFHFFVVLALISLYRDLVPYLVGIAFVLAEHFLVGLLVPGAVFSHPGQPLRWALIHASFVAAASLAHIVSWRAVERGWVDQRQNLTAEVHRLAAVVDSAGVPIFSTDLDGVILTWNEAASVLFGSEPDEVVGSPMSRLMTHEDVGWIASDMAWVGAGGSRSYDTQYTTAVGIALDVSVVVSPVRLVGGAVVGASVLVRDISERRRSERVLADRQDQLARQAEALGLMAFQDMLTGLGNRAQISEHLRAAHKGDAASSAGYGCALLLLDLDGFKHINDSLGHAVGDRLLVEVADRLRLLITAGMSAGRLGGDEFVVIVRRTDAAAASELAERVLVALQEPFRVDGSELTISASIGIAMSSDVQHLEQLLGAADMAMYAAKKRGRGGLALFEPDMQQQADDRLSLEIDLRRAVSDEQLHLAYQPLVDLKTGALAGVEALVRWSDPERAPVSPVDFIPVAEQTGLILPLGEWVLRQAAAQLTLWDEQAPAAGLVLNVNVSTRQLERPGLLAVVDELIAEGMDPARLVLEITETALTLDGPAVAETLQSLRARGVRLAVDDFGTGYSSLSRLQTAPVSQLKIDRSFVNEIADSSSLVPIIHAIVAVADGLGLGVIAEGIETPTQLHYLRRLGCAQAQGYLLSRPQDAQSISRLLDGALPWAHLLGATSDAAERRRTQSRRLSDTPSEPHPGTPAVGTDERDLLPAEVIQAAEAIAAVAAAEVAADAAVTAQAAVTAACAAALQAADKAERVATEAAAAAAEAARALAGAGSGRQPQWDPTRSLSELLGGDSYTAEVVARDVATSRTAKAAASAVMKVAAQVESVAAATAAASVRAAGLIEQRLAEDAAVTACTVASVTPPPVAAGRAVEKRSGLAVRPSTEQSAPE